MFTKDISTAQKRVYLDILGFKIGKRDPRGINTNFPGKFMVAEDYDPSQLPTRDGSNGPWCIVGDNLDALIDEAFNVWFDECAEAENAERAWRIAVATTEIAGRQSHRMIGK
jgi:hypothetical protein